VIAPGSYDKLGVADSGGWSSSQHVQSRPRFYLKYWFSIEIVKQYLGVLGEFTNFLWLEVEKGMAE